MTECSDVDVAIRFLESTEGNLEDAVDWFFDLENDDGKVSVECASLPANPNLSALTDNHFQCEDGEVGVGSASPPSEPDLYAPPTHLQCTDRGFEVAITLARKKERFLLVSLHCDSVFLCYELNRDVWRDESVENVVLCSFLFWHDVSTMVAGCGYDQIFIRSITMFAIIYFRFVSNPMLFRPILQMMERIIPTDMMFSSIHILL